MIETPRLILRPWREEDKPAFDAIINTPAMMTHFGGVAPRAQMDALIDAQIEGQARDGFSMWAVDWRETGELVGIVGLRRMPHPNLPLSGELETGWRVAERFWGMGVAREAAAASLAWGWANTGFPRAIAYTIPANTASWRLMLRLGMQRAEALDFIHPKTGEAMVVYAIDRPRAAGQ